MTAEQEDSIIYCINDILEQTYTISVSVQVVIHQKYAIRYRFIDFLKKNGSMTRIPMTNHDLLL